MMELVAVNQNVDYGIRDFLSNFNSPQTRKAYKRDLEDFFSFLSLNGFIPNSPAEITVTHFLAYRDHLKSSGKSPSTINRKFSTVRSLWSWFLTNGHIAIDPTSSIRLPKSATQKPTQAFSDEEVAAMISAPDIATFNGSVHRIAMTLLFFTGMRRSEIVNAKFEDIYEDGEYTVLKVLGKGGKLREVPLSQFAICELQNYRKRHPELIDGSYILQSYENVQNEIHYNPTTLYKMIKRYAKNLNIEKSVSPHSCRATVITKSLEEGAAITEVAHLAGHSSISTTQIYYKRRKGFKTSPVHNLKYAT